MIILGTENPVDIKDDYGYFGRKENSWKYLIDDMNYLESMMRLKYPDLPYFMIGHGMGSLLAGNIYQPMVMILTVQFYWNLRTESNC